LIYADNAKIFPNSFGHIVNFMVFIKLHPFATGGKGLLAFPASSGTADPV
jgi:hypothetical protein